MSLANPHKSGVLLDGIQIGYVDAGDDLGDASDVKWFATLVSIGGFGISKATQPNIHAAIATEAASFTASYLISQIKLQKEFNVSLVYAQGMVLEDMTELTGKELIFRFVAEDGFVTGDLIRVPAELTDTTLSGQMGSRVMVDAKLTPKGLATTTAGASS